MSDTLSPVAVARFCYGGEQAAGFDTATWRAVAASVTGPSHLNKGTGCQDAAAAATTDRWLTAAVCDGAGSAERSAEASAMVARTVVETLVAVLGGAPPRPPLRRMIVQALEFARSQIVSAATESSLDLAAFSTTVVGAICRGRRGVLFHIGDGTALAFDGTRVTATSHGSPKEYANEPRFLSQDGWQDYLVVTPVRCLDAVMLMTDGVTPFAVEVGGPKERFLVPILRHLSMYRAEHGAASLRRLLDKPEARTSVSDDKTLLCALQAKREAATE